MLNVSNRGDLQWERTAPALDQEATLSLLWTKKNPNLEADLLHSAPTQGGEITIVLLRVGRLNLALLQIWQPVFPGEIRWLPLITVPVLVPMGEMRR